MGRGRAKAMQAKIARDLKYKSPETDLQRLQAELARSKTDQSSDTTTDDEYETFEDDE